MRGQWKLTSAGHGQWQGRCSEAGLVNFHEDNGTQSNRKVLNCPKARRLQLLHVYEGQRTSQWVFTHRESWRWLIDYVHPGARWAADRVYLPFLTATTQSQNREAGD